MPRVGFHFLEGAPFASVVLQDFLAVMGCDDDQCTLVQSPLLELIDQYPHEPVRQANATAELSLQYPQRMGHDDIMVRERWTLALLPHQAGEYPRTTEPTCVDAGGLVSMRMEALAPC